MDIGHEADHRFKQLSFLIHFGRNSKEKVSNSQASIDKLLFEKNWELAALLLAELFVPFLIPTRGCPLAEPPITNGFAMDGYLAVRSII